MTLPRENDTDDLLERADALIAHYAQEPGARVAMARALGVTCQRPMAHAIGDAARCAFCEADRGEPCRLGVEP